MKNIHPLGIDLPYSDSIPIYRKFQKLTLTFLLLLTFSFVSAQTFVLDSLKYTAIDSSNIMVEKAGNCPTGELNIPNTVTDPNNNMQYTVRSIADTAFEGCNGITSVSIPSTISSIGTIAFANCNGITEITLDWDSLINISPNVFYGDSLSSITLKVPAGKVSEYQAANVWQDFSSIIENVEQQEIVSFIIDSLKYTVIDSSNIMVEKAGNCPTGELNIPNTVIDPNTNMQYTVRSIADTAFALCSAITSISIGDSLNNIGISAFYGCTSLVTLSIPDSLTSIGEGAFEGCSALESVVIPEFVSVIEEGAFEGCSSLDSINIPNSVTTIGEGAFASCSGLTSVAFGDSITSIGKSAFAACSSLDSISIPNSVTTIGDSAFAACSALTTAAIGDSVSTIGNEAFEGCIALESISIPNSVTSIGDAAFKSCSALTSAAIGDSVSNIGDAAFKSCSALDSISIPKSVTNIGQDAFASCRALTEVSVSWDTPLMITADVFSEVVLSSIILKVPSSTIYLYEASNVWQNFNSISAVHNLVETACGGFELGDSTYTSSGMYTETLSTAENNDSIVNLALTILDISVTSLTDTSCNNYVFGGDTLWASGNYSDTLIATNGCDSIVSLSVFISQSDSFFVSTIIEICEGETVQVGDSTFSEGGTFTVGFMGVNCLDSIIITTIIIGPKPIISNPQDLLLETAQDYVSYQWLKDGNEINGATSFQYNATENGNYQVEAINNNGCVVLSEFYNINSIDIKESALGRFMVYPNPTSSNATIQVPFAEEFNMEVTNVLGEIVLSQKLVNTETVLQISEFNKGIYFINLYNEKGNQTLRFVKN